MTLKEKKRPRFTIALKVYNPKIDSREKTKRFYVMRLHRLPTADSIRVGRVCLISGLRAHCFCCFFHATKATFPHETFHHPKIQSIPGRTGCCCFFVSFVKKAFKTVRSYLYRLYKINYLVDVI